MARPTNRYKAAAERARTRKSQIGPIVISSDSDNETDFEVTKWTGGVNYVFSDEDSVSEDDSEGEWFEDELKGLELVASLEKSVEDGTDKLKETQHTPYEELTRTVSWTDWKKAESNRSLGYNGLSIRTRQRRNQKARLEEQSNLKMHNT